MENQLAKYLGRDLRGVIGGIEVVSGTSKEGKPYYCIEISLINSYKKRLFLRSDEQFAWTNAIDLYDTQKQVDTIFNN